MSNINYNLYRIFCAVANSKSYAEAGEKLGFTSANISTQIKNLEKQLDVKLFNRENDGVKLTEEGKQLFEIVNKSISSFDFAEKVIKEKNDLANGTVNIGCQSHLTNYYLMEYIKVAKNDYPNLNVELTCGAVPNEMFEMLKNHKLDFVITDVIPTETDGIVIEELKKVSNIFVAKEPLKIENVKELEDLRYILNFDNTNSTKNLFKVLKEYKVKIKPNMKCDTTEIRVEAVMNGLGIAYVMKEAVKKQLENGELYEVELPIELPELSINLVYIKDMLTQVDKKFIKKYLKNK